MDHLDLNEEIASATGVWPWLEVDAFDLKDAVERFVGWATKPLDDVTRRGLWDWVVIDTMPPAFRMPWHDQQEPPTLLLTLTRWLNAPSDGGYGDHSEPGLTVVYDVGPLGNQETTFSGAVVRGGLEHSGQLPDSSVEYASVPHSPARS